MANKYHMDKLPKKPTAMVELSRNYKHDTLTIKEKPARHFWSVLTHLLGIFRRISGVIQILRYTLLASHCQIRIIDCSSSRPCTALY